MLGLLFSMSVLSSFNFASPSRLDTSNAPSMSNFLNNSSSEPNKPLRVNATIADEPNIQCFGRPLYPPPMVATNFYDCNNANLKIQTRDASTEPVHWHRNLGNNFRIPSSFTVNTCVIVRLLSHNAFFKYVRLDTWRDKGLRLKAQDMSSGALSGLKDQRSR